MRFSFVACLVVGSLGCTVDRVDLDTDDDGSDECADDLDTCDDGGGQDADTCDGGETCGRADPCSGPGCDGGDGGIETSSTTTLPDCESGADETREADGAPACKAAEGHHEADDASRR